MEIRRDPITQSWVVAGHREEQPENDKVCPLCSPEAEKLPALLTWPAEGPWQVRVLAHVEPLYHIEGELGRQADGMYDKMQPVGAHEVIVETPQHDKRLGQLSDEEIERVLWAYAARISDLKKDPRFKYVAVFKNQGVLAGEEWAHPHSQVTATAFLPPK